MQVRPTIMAQALLTAAIRNAEKDTAKKVLRHAITDDPARPLASGYNRSIIDNLRVSERTLSAIR